MTGLSRAGMRVFVWLFGHVEVQPHRYARALGLFKALIKENDFNPDDLSARAHDGLVTEALERARSRDPDGVLRWKPMIAEIVSVNEIVCTALGGKPIADKRIRDILALHEITSQ